MDKSLVSCFFLRHSVVYNTFWLEVIVVEVCSFYEQLVSCCVTSLAHCTGWQDDQVLSVLTGSSLVAVEHVHRRSIMMRHHYR